MTGHLVVPERSTIEAALRTEDLEEWLRLWCSSQGGTPRNRRFELMSAVLPFDPSQEIRVLDMCCGPGDLGRFIQRSFSRARIDCVDRDRFLLALCVELNRRRGITTRVFERDGWDPDWRLGLDQPYHVIAAATALHWFDVARLTALFCDFYDLLRPRGAFVFAEPAAPEPEFAPGFQQWAGEREAGCDIEGTAWAQFWNRANTLLGYNHQAVLKALPRKRSMIGDDGIPVLRYVELLHQAGFGRVDILLRETQCVTIAALKS